MDSMVALPDRAVLCTFKGRQGGSRLQESHNDVTATGCQEPRYERASGEPNSSNLKSPAGPGTREFG